MMAYLLIKEFGMTDLNTTDIEQTIRDQIANHSVLLYMKGTPQFPQCGFSARAVEVLTQINWLSP